jgi:hypothetical protein
MFASVFSSGYWMPTRFSDVLRVSHARLERLGAFDAFVDIDSKLYVDPYLLTKTRIPELKYARRGFLKHFRDVLSLIRASKRKGDVFWRNAESRLLFPEIPSTGLGYGENTTQGSAVGRKLAAELIETASEIVRAGVTDPTIFELVGLFQENMGPDRISDVTVALTLPQLERYNTRLARRLGIKRRPCSIGGVAYDFPFDPRDNEPVIILPRSLLCDLPVAHSYADVVDIAVHNSALRKRINELIGKDWRSTVRKFTKADLRDLFVRHPDILREVIDAYKHAPADPYDFDRDPSGETSWLDVARRFSRGQPLDLTRFKPVKPANVVEVVRAICQQFKTLIEDNGLYEHLYNEKATKRKRERAAQLLFFGVAEMYCSANGLDMSREPNAGAGPVDFKVSAGPRGRVLVEIKLSTNPRLRRGYERQLKRYVKAEKARHAFYVIIRVHESEAGINAVLRESKRRKTAGEFGPEVMVVDGRWQESASRA